VAKTASDPTVTTCYRHPSRETGVSCSSCGRPICPDCMTPTPVGMRCPECARQKTKVRTAATLTKPPELTYALIAINVAVFVAMASTGGGISSTSGTIYLKGVLYAPYVADGEWYRIVTSGFMHAGLWHIALNMYALYWLGMLLEPQIGRLRFGLIYAVSLVAGSVGALVLSPNAGTLGASGAIFGLMGAAIVAMRARGINPMQSGIGVVLLLNLAITFLPGVNISIGGHVGGLIAGSLVGYLMLDVAERRRIPSRVVYAGASAMVVALAVAAVVVAQAAPAPTF
jgi:membrane associated rhomboid family serine protease